MLLKLDTLREIRRGAVSLAFRRWKRPTVRSGGRLRTAIGVLAIGDVRPCTLADITEAESRRAGFASRAALLAELRGRAGRLYRIELRLAGADPRLALRERAALDPSELTALLQRLRRMDARGPWTRAVLERLRDAPGVRAADLAAELGLERTDFKRRVRRLKELGLTESLETGYRLSPRGRALLETPSEGATAAARRPPARGRAAGGAPRKKA